MHGTSHANAPSAPAPAPTVPRFPMNPPGQAALPPPCPPATTPVPIRPNDILKTAMIQSSIPTATAAPAVPNHSGSPTQQPLLHHAPITLIQQGPPPQGHIFTGRVQGVCPSVAQQRLQAPQGQQGAPSHEAVVLAPPQYVSAPCTSLMAGGQVVTVSGVTSNRVAFQNIAPKPAPQAQSPQPQPQQPQQQSLVIVSQNQQPQHCIRPSHPSNRTDQSQSSNHPTAAHTVSRFPKCTDPNPAPVQQAPAQHSQPHAVCQAAVSAESTSTPSPTYLHRIQSDQTVTASERGPSTPGGKLILPAPQVPAPASTRAPSPQVVIPGDQQRSDAVSTSVERATYAEAPCRRTGAVPISILPGQIISTSTPGTLLQATPSNQVTFTVVPNSGFPGQGAQTPPTIGLQLTPPLPIAGATSIPPFRGDKIICQKEEEAKDATGLHIHERKIEVMENKLCHRRFGQSQQWWIRRGGWTCGKAAQREEVWLESTSIPLREQPSRGAKRPCGASGWQRRPWKQTPSDPKKLMVNGVCDFDRSDATHPSKNIPNHKASKHMGNGEVLSPQKAHGALGLTDSLAATQQDTAKAEQAERLANGPSHGAEISNGPNSETLGLRQQHPPHNPLPTSARFRAATAASR